jgi:hypothetical protein
MIFLILCFWEINEIFGKFNKISKLKIFFISLNKKFIKNQKNSQKSNNNLIS